MLFGDFHIHTRNSGDGRQTFSDVVAAAREKGLKQVGVSDHGFRHVANGTTVKKQEKLFAEVNEFRQNNSDVEAFCSIEANFCSLDGSIDLTDGEAENLDYVIAGFHKTTFPKTWRDAFALALPSALGVKQFSATRLNEYTRACVAAIKSGKVDILAHPCYCLPLNMNEVGKAAVDYGVLIELNGKRVNMTDEQIMQLYALGVKFVANSDAHTKDRVGDCALPLSVVERLKITSAVANWDNLLTFKKR